MEAQSPRVIRIADIVALQTSGLLDLLVKFPQHPLITAYHLQVALDPIVRQYGHINSLLLRHHESLKRNAKSEAVFRAECALLHNQEVFLPAFKPVQASQLSREFYAELLELMDKKQEVNFYQFDWLLVGLSDYLGTPYNELQFVRFDKPNEEAPSRQDGEGAASDVRAPTGLEAELASTGEGNPECPRVEADQNADSEASAATCERNECKPARSDYEVATSPDRA